MIFLALIFSPIYANLLNEFENIFISCITYCMNRGPMFRCQFIKLDNRMLKINGI